jgi:6-phosphogluconolactonase (cycloisomerase 2 family)
MKRLFALVSATIFGACADDPGKAPTAPQLSSFENRAAQTTGSVYTMSNSASGNEVLVYSRAANGALTPAGTIATGGDGSGAGLGNQGGVTLSHDRKWLVVVNAGSNEVSLFAVAGDGSLTLTDVAQSGGTLPVSATIHGNRVFVANEGSANIAGFHFDAAGDLTSIGGSSRPLSAGTVDVAQIQFSPRGDFLVVTEKNTNVLSVYRVDASGAASGPRVNASNGMTPFGFAFTSGGVLVVSEAFGGGVDASAASSYAIRTNGTLETISSSVGTTETAACWFVVTGDNRYAYTTNTGSGTISGYSLSRGRLTLLDADGETGIVGPGTSPIDLALADGSRLLYSLNAGTHTIAAFRVRGDGSLEKLRHGVSGLPASTNGLAAY